MIKLLPALGLCALGCFAPMTHAVVAHFNATGSIVFVDGDYAPDLSVGQTVIANYTVETDESLAAPDSDPTPSLEPGHEYSSFWNFPGSPYAGAIEIPAVGGSFANTVPMSVVVNDNLFLTADETANQLTDDFYDWIELLASNTIGICLEPGGICGPEDRLFPADGEEWTLAIFSDTSWITDGSMIPEALPASWTALIVGQRFNALGDESGVVVASVSSLSMTAVPLPAAVWLFASGLGLLGLVRRSHHR